MLRRGLVRGELVALFVMAIVAARGARVHGAERTGSLAVASLRWDGRDRPVGLIQFEPRISWVVSTRVRGQRQTAYQVLVARDPAKLLPGRADLWDSGKIPSGDSTNIRYGGPTPEARQRAYFTVRVWDTEDRPSAFAAASLWEMGLYDEEWEGQWIGRPQKAGERFDTHDRSVTYLRKTFAVAKPIAMARLYASAFGVYEMSVNGKRAGAHVLAPGYTDYEKRVLFQTYDVTAHVRRGDNAIGAIVGGGWCTAALGGRAGACGFEPPRVMAQLELTFGDGTREVIITDPSWRVHAGPVLSSHLYDGETYDARLELPGWDTPSYREDAAGGWLPAAVYDKKKERDLVADAGPPITVAEELRAVAVSQPRPGVFVFDFGQNLVGWARIEGRAQPGATVTLRHAEMLRPDGSLYVENLRAAQATDRYVAKDAQTFRWEPRFSVHGFRYVEVSGLGAKPALTARVVHSAMSKVGTLETSNPKLNRLLANIDWSMRGAFLSVPTKGPQRDERLGSLLEAGVFANTACLGRDVRAFMRKWMDDVRDAQLQDAAYAPAAPSASATPAPPPAAAAGVLVPSAFARCYGDRGPLDAHLPSMGRWLHLVRAKHPNLVWTSAGKDAAVDPYERGPRTDPALVATAQLAHAAQSLARIARQGGPSLAGEAATFEGVAKGAREAFAKRFLLPDGRLASDTQTAYALALALDLVPAEAVPRVGQRLVAAVEREGVHLAAGVIGAAHILPALSRIGRDDVAYALLLQESCPSWLCSVENGATTVWEKWDGFTKAGGFAKDGGGSFNDYAFGAVGEWMWSAIGGITLDPDAPGGKHVFVRPRPGGGLTFARARHDSAYGPITTEWRRDAKSFHLKVSVPANGTATVTLPVAGAVTESGQPLERAAGVRVLGAGPSGLELSVASGSYDFVVATP